MGGTIKPNAGLINKICRCFLLLPGSWATGVKLAFQPFAESGYSIIFER